MGFRDRFRRSGGRSGRRAAVPTLPAAPPAPTDTPSDDQPATPGAAEAWRALPPIRPTADPDAALVSDLAHFRSRVSTYRDPTFRTPPGHLVSPEAPAGLARDLLAPAGRPRVDGALAGPFPVVLRDLATADVDPIARLIASRPAVPSLSERRGSPAGNGEEARAGAAETDVPLGGARLGRRGAMTSVPRPRAARRLAVVVPSRPALAINPPRVPPTASPETVTIPGPGPQPGPGTAPTPPTRAPARQAPPLPARVPRVRVGLGDPLDTLPPTARSRQASLDSPPVVPARRPTPAGAAPPPPSDRHPAPPRSTGYPPAPPAIQRVTRASSSPRPVATPGRSPAPKRVPEPAPRAGDVPPPAGSIPTPPTPATGIVPAPTITPMPAAPEPRLQRLTSAHPPVARPPATRHAAHPAVPQSGRPGEPPRPPSSPEPPRAPAPDSAPAGPPAPSPRGTRLGGARVRPGSPAAHPRVVRPIVSEPSIQLVPGRALPDLLESPARPGATGGVVVPIAWKRSQGAEPAGAPDQRGEPSRGPGQHGAPSQHGAPAPGRAAGTAPREDQRVTGGGSGPVTSIESEPVARAARSERVAVTARPPEVRDLSPTAPGLRRPPERLGAPTRTTSAWPPPLADPRTGGSRGGSRPPAPHPAAPGGSRGMSVPVQRRSAGAGTSTGRGSPGTRAASGGAAGNQAGNQAGARSPAPAAADVVGASTEATSATWQAPEPGVVSEPSLDAIIRGFSREHLDALARRLIDPIGRLIRADLRLGRERTGRLRDGTR